MPPEGGTQNPSLTAKMARDILGSLRKWLKSPFLLLNYTKYSF
jgi:hypothetical protein